MLPPFAARIRARGLYAARMDWRSAADQTFLLERSLLVGPRKAVLDMRASQAPGGIAEPCLLKGDE
jgi:hypothetical protein